MKAILVIDTPKNCGDCRFRGLNTGWYCACFGEDKSPEIFLPLDEGESRPEWCPLKPIPHKLQADWYTDGYKEGFNTCLEEIEK